MNDNYLKDFLKELTSEFGRPAPDTFVKLEDILKRHLGDPEKVTKDGTLIYNMSGEKDGR